MKISKTLLGAILVGVSVQVTVSSCTKETKVKPQSEAIQQASESNTPPNNPPNSEPCPACGMG